MPKEEQRSDAVRSEPIFLDEHGRKFWILRCYSEKRDILLQGLVTFIIQSFRWFYSVFRLQFLTFIFHRIVDVQRGELVSIKERWYSYDVEQKAIVMKHISSLRCKKNINLNCYPHVFYSFDSIEEFGRVILENSYLLQLIVKN